MSQATIRTAIKDLLETVSGVTGGAGKVVEEDPHVTRLEELIAEVGGGGGGLPLNGWLISREAFDEFQQQAFRTQVIHRFIVKAVHSMTDSPATTSRLVFQTLLQSVQDTFRKDLTIWVTGRPEQSEDSVRATPIGQASFGSVVVHYAEVRLDVEEYEIEP